MKTLIIKLLIKLGFSVELRTKDLVKSGNLLLCSTAVVLQPEQGFPSCVFYLTGNGSTKVQRHTLKDAYRLLDNYKLYFYKVDKYTRNKSLYKALRIVNRLLQW